MVVVVGRHLEQALSLWVSLLSLSRRCWRVGSFLLMDDVMRLNSLIVFPIFSWRLGSSALVG